MVERTAKVSIRMLLLHSSRRVTTLKVLVVAGVIGRQRGEAVQQAG